MTSVRFKSLSSGSCGNCYFLGLFEESGKCSAGVIIDAGVSPRRLKKELAADGLSFNDFSAILVTHDHMDHIRSLGSFCKIVQKEVWTTKKLHASLSRHPMTRGWIGAYRKILPEDWVEIVPGKMSVRWFEVPHDASQTVGYTILTGGRKFTIMTDIGSMTDEALELAAQSDTVVLESNYDAYMLEHGPYPLDLQERIRGGHGHLSNVECAAAIRSFLHPGLKNIFLCHLSEHNNTPDLAYNVSREAIPESFGRLLLAPLPRQSASPLYTL